MSSDHSLFEATSSGPERVNSRYTSLFRTPLRSKRIVSDSTYFVTSEPIGEPSHESRPTLREEVASPARRGRSDTTASADRTGNGMNGASETGAMRGLKGLILGVANNRSIAWGIAKAAHAAGAEIGMTFQGEALEKRVRPLAQELGAHVLGHCDVTDGATIDAVFAEAQRALGRDRFRRPLHRFRRQGPVDGPLRRYDRGQFHACRWRSPAIPSPRSRNGRKS